MKKSLLLILSAAMVIMTTGLTVGADTIVFDAVLIQDVTDDGFLYGFPDQEPTLVTYDLLTAAYLPRPVPQEHPPEPCLPVVRRWNKVIAANQTPQWKQKQFVHLLRRMGTKGCRVLIEYDDEAGFDPIDATAIQPDAL